MVSIYFFSAQSSTFTGTFLDKLFLFRHALTLFKTELKNPTLCPSLSVLICVLSTSLVLGVLLGVSLVGYLLPMSSQQIFERFGGHPGLPTQGRRLPFNRALPTTDIDVRNTNIEGEVPWEPLKGV